MLKYAAVGRLLIILVVSAARLSSAAVSQESVTALVKTLAYDQGLSARLTKEPVPVLAVGVSCSLWPQTARVAGHGTKCEQASLSAGLVNEAATRGGVVVLGDVERAQANVLAVQAREAAVPVLALREALMTQDVLLGAEGTKLLLGERAIKQLGAKFPAAILKVATIVGETVDEEEPTVRDMVRDGEYPDEAREANVEGVVKLKVNVDVQGRVTDVVVVKGLGFGLDEEAIRRVKRFRFNPGRREGVPVPMSTTFNFRFTLQD